MLRRVYGIFCLLGLVAQTVGCLDRPPDLPGAAPACRTGGNGGPRPPVGWPNEPPAFTVLSDASFTARNANGCPPVQPTTTNLSRVILTSGSTPPIFPPL